MKAKFLVFFVISILLINLQSLSPQTVASKYFEKDQYLFLDTDWGNSFFFNLRYGYTRLWTKPSWTSVINDSIITKNFKKWMHLVIIYNSPVGYIKTYINNKVVKTDTTWPGLGANVGLHSKFAIGSYISYDGIRSSFFCGKIDEFRVYNRELNNSEISELFNNTNSLVSLKDGLYLYYPFNNNTNDESGKNNHGNAGSATLSTDRFGNKNSALNFDGIDDYLESTNPLPDMASITISAWIYINDTFPPILKTDEKVLGFSPTQDENHFTIKSNLNWNYSCDADWLSFKVDTFQDSYDYGNYYLTVFAQPNLSINSRTDSLAITLSNNETIYIPIIQEGKAYKWKYYTISDGLPNNNVICIAIDSKNNKWIATSNGISKFDGSSWKTFTTEDGLASNNITCLAIDADDNVWVGTDYGISLYDGVQWTSNLIPANIISYIYLDISDNVWIGTSGNDIYKWNKTSWENIKLPFNNINSILIDKNQRIWVAAGHVLYHSNSNLNWDTVIYLYASRHRSIEKIYLDKKENVWVTGKNGQQGICFGCPTYFIKKITDGKINEVTFFNENISFKAVCSDKKGNTWLGNDNWLRKYTGDYWVKYLESDGLKCSLVNCIAVDTGNLKWIGTDNGILVLDDSEIYNISVMAVLNPKILTINPNPASNQIHFASPTSSSQPSSLELFDYTGRLIFTQTLPVKQQGENVTVNLGKQPEGVYLVRFRVGEKLYSGKVLVVK